MAEGAGDGGHRGEYAETACRPCVERAQCAPVGEARFVADVVQLREEGFEVAGVCRERGRVAGECAEDEAVPGECAGAAALRLAGDEEGGHGRLRVDAGLREPLGVGQLKVWGFPPASIGIHALPRRPQSTRVLHAAHLLE